MSGVREYWEGSTFVVEWTMVDPDGNPIHVATVTGTVKEPGGATAAMVVTAAGNVYRAEYTAAAAGTHAWELDAGGTGVDNRQGAFIVRRDLVGLPPITTDPSTPVGTVRLLITDTDEVLPLFTDEQLAALLTVEGGVVKRGAAAALETIATSETLIAKKISTQDLSTDGPAVATSLMGRAKTLREQADAADGGVVNPDDYGFDFVDFPTVGTHPGVWWS